MIFTDNMNECKQIFVFFEEICRIPHGSGHTDAIADYLVSFATSRGLSFERDAHNNVLIRKDATRGYEDHPTVILQGHTDMVLAKRQGCERDLLHEGIELFVDGDFLRAKDTTLGADDGVAVAYALAILDDDTLPHPPLEALFTSDEEIGLLGAAALDTSWLRGRMLLNIDSDGEGVFTVGCAGGVRCDIDLPCQREGACGTAYRLTVSGLVGGHSGAEIHTGRANALRLVGELLCELPAARLVSLSGGQADNAIAPDATLTLFADGDIPSQVKTLEARVRQRHGATDPNLYIQCESAEADAAFTAEDTRRVAACLTELPNGVVSMSRDIQGLVQTSLNVGIAQTTDDGVSICISVRSSLEEDRAALVDRLRTFAEASGGTFTTRGAYPAWEYRKESPLRDTACAVYARMYGKDAVCTVIHAGLECGVFAGKIDGFDAISLGPDNYDLHTPDERLSISSTVRVYRFITELLRAL